jgi:hypothetical protein
MTRPRDGITGAAGGRGRLRASHADREQAIDTLKAAFVEDRLTKDEFDVRVSQAFASRTYAELAAVTADIPVELVAVPSPRPTRARPENTTAKTGSSVIFAATVLTAGMWAGALFSQADSPAVGMLVWAFTFTWLGIVCLVGSVMLESRRQKLSRRELPPSPSATGPAARSA